MGASHSAAAGHTSPRAIKRKVCYFDGTEATLEAVNLWEVTRDIWENRKHPDIVETICNGLSQMVAAKAIFDQVEFYLPQLAHMILYLENDWPTSAMEQFVLLVSQSSVHFALQFFWILYAALDENRPKAGGNFRIYMRCAQLLLNVEQCLVYGSPNARRVQELLERGDISKGEVEKLLMADRRYFATHTSDSCTTSQGNKPQVQGWLYKKGGGTSKLGRRSWNQRWCRLERRTILVYTSPQDFYAYASITLGTAKVLVKNNNKHSHYFEVHDTYSSAIFKFSALSGEDMTRWVEAITAAAEGPAPPPSSPNRRPAAPAEKDEVASASSLPPPSSFPTNASDLSQQRAVDDLAIKVSPPKHDGMKRTFSCETFSAAKPDILALAVGPITVSSKLHETDRNDDQTDKKSEETDLKNRDDTCAKKGIDGDKHAEVNMKEDDFVKEEGQKGDCNNCDSPIEDDGHPGPISLAEPPTKVNAIAPPSPPHLQQSFNSASLSSLTLAHTAPTLTRLQSKRQPSGSSLLGPNNFSPEESARYQFFTEQRNFIKALTDVSEELRLKEPSQRQKQLSPLLKNIRIPASAYIPLCRSTDRYFSVLRICTQEGCVFSTNERSPCLIFFEVLEDPGKNDVSGALNAKLFGREAVTMSPDGEKGERIVEKAGNQAHAPGLANKAPSTSTLGSMDSSLSHLCPLETETAAKEEQVGGGAVEYHEVSKEKSSSSSLTSPAEVPTIKKIQTQIFGELWEERKERLRTLSPYGSLQGWNLLALIAKSHDDLRQEMFVMQLITYFRDIFKAEGLPLYLHPYKIISTGAKTGLIEYLKNAKSLDSLKKSKDFRSLRHLFEQLYGGPESESFKTAQRNFTNSLAAYSLMCYILAIKDRHNGNIMLDVDGYLIHIDYGFLLGKAPGGNFSFETAPFKLTLEMVAVMGGKESEEFKRFRSLCVQGMLVAKKNASELLKLVEIMSFKSSFLCFQNKEQSQSLSGLRDRLLVTVPDNQVPAVVNGLIDRSYNHSGTSQYDQYQQMANGIRR